MLQNSTQDDILLSHEVEVRLKELQQSYLDRVGNSLVVPVDLQPDYKRFIQMRMRHRQGDFRHSADESLSLKAVAQWTVNVNSALRGQVTQRITWKD